MDDPKISEHPPWWVLIALRHGKRRDAAVFAILVAILGQLSLIFAIVAIWNESTSGRILFCLQLLGGCIFLGGAIWYWLAIRWIDRKGQWGKEP